MKATLFATLLLAVAIAQAQWTLTPEGFENSKSGDENLFVPLNMDQQTLYNHVRTFVIETYNVPDEVMSENEPNSISILGNESQLIRRNKTHAFNLTYGMVIHVFDNGIGISPPEVRLHTSSYGKPQNLHLVYGADLTGYDLGIWNPKGKLKSELAKDDLETFFNGWTSSLLEYLQSSP